MNIIYTPCEFQARGQLAGCELANRDPPPTLYVVSGMVLVSLSIKDVLPCFSSSAEHALIVGAAWRALPPAGCWEGPERR